MAKFKEPKAQTIENPKGPPPFTLGPLGTLNQLVKALSKTLRAMADDTIDSQKGARICNGLGIMRACLETRTLEELAGRLDRLEGGDNSDRPLSSDREHRHWQQ
jgi:hypothetical protein